MDKIKQRRYGAETWRKILGRYEESGTTALAFCAREGISTKSLRRWQLRLGGDSDQELVAKAAVRGGANTGDFRRFKNRDRGRSAA